MSADPPRLREDPASPSGLRELLAHGEPPPRLGAATKAASAAAVATLAGGSAAAASTATATAAGTKLWLLLGGLAVTGLVGGGVALVAGSLPAREARPTETPAEPASARARSLPLPESTLPESTLPESTLPAAEEPAPRPDDPVEAPPAQRERSPAPSRARQPAAERPAPERAASAGGLLVEASLLERARSLLATDPGAALAATERHRREHPRAQLVAERELIAIDALQRLRRYAEARRRARRMIERAPDGIYAERARAILQGLPD
ncbi:MAG: hypothetical protein RID81_43600 [Sandaracinaceae bacterium]